MSVLSVTLQCFEFSSKKKQNGVQQLIYVNNY